MGSTRLAGKVLKPIDGRPMLSYQLERLRRARLAERIVIATSTSPADDAIARFCEEEEIECFRGSETDVLSRFHGAALQSGADVVVRVTADCPLIDPALIDSAIGIFEGAASYDYLSNMLDPTWPYGMAVEVFSFVALEAAHREARDSAEREHVTPFLYWRPERFRLHSLTTTPDLSHHRWTVDTPEDFELVSRILANAYRRNPQFTMPDVLALLEEHPDWVNLNSHVRQIIARPTGDTA